MTSTQVAAVDCRVEVRKYVLVTSSAKEAQRLRDRVVVQSPMLVIPETVSFVPVKHFSGEKENFVCLIPRGDIEEESSDIYERARVSRTTSWVDAHGIAIVDSGLDDELEYQRGDRFWISIGHSTNEYQTSVPVINLRTFETGLIPIGNVCWYPKIQGPDEELWTLGGVARKLKLSGSHKFTSMSWAICQKLDETPSTAKDVQIPTKGERMGDRYELPVTQRRALFMRRYKCLMSERSDDSSTALPTSSGEESSLPDALPEITLNLPTPPSTPDGKEPEPEPEPEQKKSSHVHTALQDVHIEAWRRIFEMADPRKRYMMVQPSVTGTQKPPSPRPRKPRRLSIDSDSSSDENATFSNYVTSTSESAGTRELYPSPQPSHSPGEDVSGGSADSILACYTKEKENPTGRVAASDRAWNAKMCDLKDPKCQYSTMHTSKHYHSPADKCQISYPRKPHEHCVSRLRPLPDKLGDCILMSRPSRSHECCVWTYEDRSKLAPVTESMYDDRKVEEARRKRLKVYDTRERTQMRVEDAQAVELDSMELFLPFPNNVKSLFDEVDRGELEFDPTKPIDPNCDWPSEFAYL